MVTDLGASVTLLLLSVQSLQLDRNLTKMKTISTQVFDEFTAHNFLSGFVRK
jgi:hypothetical protein